MSRIEELEKKLAADPNSRIFVQLAEEYRKQGLLDNAIEICEQGLTKHPQYPSARVALGRALLEAKTYDRACEEFESVLAQIPDNILANKFLGETYHRLGRYDEAIQKYQIAQTLSPEDMDLEGQIEAVKAEMAAGGPPPPPPEPADEAAPTDRPHSASASPTDTPMGVPVAPPSAAAAEPLEPTLVDTRVTPDTRTTPPVPPVPDELMAQEEAAPPQEDLAPIPLVDVDEPMVLEGPAYSKVTSESEPPPLEPVPIVSSTEAFDMTPPLSAAPATPPAPPEAVEPPPPPPPPPPLEPPPLEPPKTETALPPLDDVPSAFETPFVESATFEPPPVDPAPIEVAATDASTGGDIETPTMAELYAAQGHFDKAVLVYRNLFVLDPNETKYLERIEELEMLANASAASATVTPGGRVEPGGDAHSDANTRDTIGVLEQWLDVIRRSRGT